MKDTTPEDVMITWENDHNVSCKSCIAKYRSCISCRSEHRLQALILMYFKIKLFRNFEVLQNQQLSKLLSNKMMILKYFKIKLFLNFERENVNFAVKVLQEASSSNWWPFNFNLTLITYLNSVKLEYIFFHTIFY